MSLDSKYRFLDHVPSPYREARKYLLWNLEKKFGKLVDQNGHPIRDGVFEDLARKIEESTGDSIEGKDLKRNFCAVTDQPVAKLSRENFIQKVLNYLNPENELDPRFPFSDRSGLLEHVRNFNEDFTIEDEKVGFEDQHPRRASLTLLVTDILGILGLAFLFLFDFAGFGTIPEMSVNVEKDSSNAINDSRKMRVLLLPWISNNYDINQKVGIENEFKYFFQ